MVELMEVIKKEPEDGTAPSQSLQEAGAKNNKVGAGVDHEEEPSPSSGNAKKKKKKKKKTGRKQGVPDPQLKRACVDCTARCSRVHGRAGATASSLGKAPPPVAAALPSFFKVMTGYFSEKLDIPAPFAKTISGLEDTNVYLEDAFGLRWRVFVCARDGRLSFGHGWANFVLDHAVAVGEFLVFRHIARSVFAVQIFASSACERLLLCERNKRQSRKRKKPQGEMTMSSVGDRAVKLSKKSNADTDKRSKKQQLACDLLDGDRDKAQEYQCQDHVVDEYTEAQNCGGSDFATPLAMMDLDDEITDDIFLTADAYEFDTDLCAIPEEPEAFPVDNGMEEPVTHGKTSRFSSAEMISSRSWGCTVGAGLWHGEKLACLENEQMADAPVKGSNNNVAVHGNKLSELRENSSSGVEAQVPSSERAMSTCHKKDEDKLMELPSNDNQVETKEAIVLEDSSEEEHDDDPRMQDGTGDAAAEIISGSSTKAGELGERRRKRRMPLPPAAAGNHKGAGLSLAPSSRRLSVAAPPADQTWLELPCRLAVVPRRKKQGRKVVVLEDPRGRRWPVLYLCTPTFSGFVAGWAEVRAENGLREGDACELQLRRGGSGSNSELVLRVAGSQEPLATDGLPSM